MATNLITRAEYIQATGQVATNLQQAELDQIDWAVAKASQIVRLYTDRDFTLTADIVPNPSDREFRYYGNYVLDIPDAAAVTQVATKATSFAQSRVLDATEWYAMPMEDPVLTYIEIYSLLLPTGKSPEMGFLRNLDRYPSVPYPSVLVVTATWGWSVIPEDVKQATVLTATEIIADPLPFTAESIAGYSRSRATSRSLSPGLTIQALPDRAAAILDPYARWAV